MSKFKVGDKVKRVKGYFNGMVIGDTDLVVGTMGSTGVLLKKYVDKNYSESTHSTDSLVLAEPIEYPNRPQKHAEVIKAWADGAAIEALFRISGKWVTVTDEYPNFFTNIEYRIKPVIDNQAEIAKLMKELEEVSVRLRKEVQVINSKLNELIIS